MICQLLPRDSFGRCLYINNNFYNILINVKFLTLKNSIIEENGNELQKYLLNICKLEEIKYSQLKGMFVCLFVCLFA